jgi:predicted class III extradiol MEMO1 family dioxygenase
MLALSAAGFHTHAADVMTKMESLGEDLELFVASHVVEVFLPFLDCSGGTDRKAVPAGTTIPR